MRRTLPDVQPSGPPSASAPWCRAGRPRGRICAGWATRCPRRLRRGATPARNASIRRSWTSKWRTCHSRAQSCGGA
eukprot:181217-Chlamydomonas_euryale.AAC.5